ncbi:MAG: hypothetical protein JST00_11160 [Deltaproteobacteria bacterium]|nr:hypothetical protein [Deltaproteobacteria bacterium]
MPRRSLVVVGASSTMLLTACYFTTSFDGLSSGGATASDGGSGTDATGADASTDASSDAKTDAAADAGEPCVVPGLTTRMCDAFERTTPQGSWASETTTNGGKIEISEDTTTNSRVFHCRVPALDTSLAQAYLRHETSIGQRLRFEGDLRYTPGVTDNARQLLNFDIGGAGTIYVLMFVATAQGFAFYEQIDPGLPAVRTKVHLLKTPVAPGAWHRLTLDVDLLTNKATVLVDGNAALPATEAFDLLPEFKGSELGIKLGPSYSANPSTAMDVYFDNVVIATD